MTDETHARDRGLMSRKFLFAVGLLAAALFSRWMNWIDGAQLSAWATAIGLYYLAANAGQNGIEAAVGVIRAWLDRAPKQ